jgi:uncharacterized protein (TIGR03437 family)
VTVSVRSRPAPQPTACARKILPPGCRPLASARVFVGVRPILFAVLFSLSRLALAAPGYLLGSDYSHPIDGVAAFDSVVVDDQGSVYTAQPNSVQKCTSDGRFVWQTTIGFSSSAIAVDKSGNVYAVGSAYSANLIAIVRIGPDGVAAQPLSLGTGLRVNAAAIDANGRLWVTGQTIPQFANPLRTTSDALQQSLPNTLVPHGFVARLNPAGTAIVYATYLAGSGTDLPSAISVDNSASAFIAGSTTSPDFPLTAPAHIGEGVRFLMRLKPTGTGLVYSVIVASGASANTAVAADGGGDASVTYLDGPTWSLAHFDPDGALRFSKSSEGPALAMDAAGNTYVSGPAAGNRPVKNTIGACGSVYLDVFGPDGALLQATWVPAGAFLVAPISLLVAADSTVFLLSRAQPSLQFVTWLTAFSPNASAQPLALACVADAADYRVPYSIPFGAPPERRIAPGEIVSLFGNGLGPADGAQPAVTLESGFPTELAGVQVLFNGQPAPLLYVQEAQINAVVPWQVAGEITICVSYRSVLTNCIVEPVIFALPGIFTIDGVHAAAVNQDETINSAAHPAPPGSIVSVFGTGFGPVAPAVKDGSIVTLPLPSNALDLGLYVPASAASAAMVVAVTYAGPAPFQVAGVTQINFRVPASLSTSWSVLTVNLWLGGPNLSGTRTTQFTLWVGVPE